MKIKAIFLRFFIATIILILIRGCIAVFSIAGMTTCLFDKSVPESEAISEAFRDVFQGAYDDEIVISFKGPSSKIARSGNDFLKYSGPVHNGYINKTIINNDVVPTWYIETITSDERYGWILLDKCQGYLSFRH